MAEVGGELTHPDVDGLFSDLGRVEVCLASRLEATTAMARISLIMGSRRGP